MISQRRAIRFSTWVICIRTFLLQGDESERSFKRPNSARSRNHEPAAARTRNSEQNNGERYANARCLNSVRNQCDRLISEEPDFSSRAPSSFSSFKPVWHFLSFSVLTFFFHSHPRQLFSIRFIPPSALSRKASRFDALNRPFHWQSGYYETSQKIPREDVFEIAV